MGGSSPATAWHSSRIADCMDARLVIAIYFCLCRIMSKHSRVDHHLGAGTAEQHLHAVQHIASENAFFPGKITLQLARVVLAVDMGIDLKCQRRNQAASYSTEGAGHPSRWLKL